MEIALVVLRPLHILLGIVWIGFGSLLAWVLHPAADKAGEKGLAMLRTFYSNSTIGLIMPVAALGTTLAGLILWGIRADGMDLSAFGATGDMVMAVGALAGTGVPVEGRVVFPDGAQFPKGHPPMVLRDSSFATDFPVVDRALLEPDTRWVTAFDLVAAKAVAGSRLVKVSAGLR